MRTLAALLMAPILLLPGCGEDDGPEQETPSSITGVIVDVESTSPTEVSRFTLKDQDETYEVEIDARRDYGFPLSHLQEHVVTADPVTVELEERNGTLVARSIEDA